MSGELVLNGTLGLVHTDLFFWNCHFSFWNSSLVFVVFWVTRAKTCRFFLESKISESKTFLSVAFFEKSATEFQRGRTFDIQHHFKCFFSNKFLMWVFFLNYEWNHILRIATLNSFRNSGITLFPVTTFDCQHYFPFLTLGKLLQVILINVNIWEGL